MKSGVIKRSIVLNGRKTSISLEDAFWIDTKMIAARLGKPLTELVGEIDRNRPHSNLSSAVRLFVLDHFMSVVVSTYANVCTIDPTVVTPVGKTALEDR